MAIRWRFSALLGVFLVGCSSGEVITDMNP
jgi:hypothetical protein